MDVNQKVKSNDGDWVEIHGEAWKAQVEGLKSKFSSAIESVLMPLEYPTDVPIVFVERDQVIEVLQHLKTDSACEYDFLADLTATDDENEEKRFHLIYNLYSTRQRRRIRVKVRLSEAEKAKTAISVWKGANWAEREVWDMFGIDFEGHPDLRRILNDERFEGFALRKDYPIRGYQIFPEAGPIHEELLVD